MYEELTAKSYALRKKILKLIYTAKTGHIGGDYSVCDILVTLYNQVMNITPENFNTKNRDHFILSKGHSVEALYAVLSDRGFFPESELETYSQYGSKYIGHPNNKVNGIEMNSGSLGHGLSVACGMALAERMNSTSNRTYVVMGDGELAEGSVWEGAMLAGHYKLDNLCAVIDRNRLQISGSTEYVMTQDSQDERWSSFGWNVIHAHGNDIESIVNAFDIAGKTKGRPTMIIADTTKGCGVSFMENKAPWHHKVPSSEEFDAAMAELDSKEKEALNHDC